MKAGMGALIFCAAAFLFGAVLSADHDSINCITYGDNPRCYTTGNTFSYEDTDDSVTPNSQCKRTFKVTAAALGSNHKGFCCKAYMDVPEQMHDVYSISHSYTNSVAQTPLVYGVGLNAFIRGRQAPFRNIHNGESWTLAKAHTHPDDNHFSYMGYCLEDGKLDTNSSSGQIGNYRSTFLFTPTTTPTYIGVNRKYYPTSSYRGSGVCRMHCYTTGATSGSEPPSDTGAPYYPPLRPEVPITGPQFREIGAQLPRNVPGFSSPTDKPLEGVDYKPFRFPRFPVAHRNRG